MKRRNKLEKYRLIGAIIILGYFAFILLIYYFKLEFQLFRIIGELLTIPALLVLVFLPIWAIVDAFLKKNKNQTTYILTLIVSLATMAMLLVANYFSS